jgi:hypothetical protein
MCNGSILLIVCDLLGQLVLTRVSEHERVDHVGAGGRWYVPEDHELLRLDALDLQLVLAAS